MYHQPPEISVWLSPSSRSSMSSGPPFGDPPPPPVLLPPEAPPAPPLLAVLVPPPPPPLWAPAPPEDAACSCRVKASSRPSEQLHVDTPSAMESGNCASRFAITKGGKLPLPATAGNLA